MSKSVKWLDLGLFRVKELEKELEAMKNLASVAKKAAVTADIQRKDAEKQKDFLEQEVRAIVNQLQ